MRAFTVFVVLVGLTGAVVALRGAFVPAVDAARDTVAKRKAHQPGIDVKPPPEGAALPVVPVSDDTQTRLARLAAEAGRELLELARKQPDNPRLLEQAAAHFRACLSHESDATDASLFREARSRLAQIEKQLATPPAPLAPHTEELPPPLREAPTPPVAAAPTPTTNDEPLMVTPEGVPIRRQRSRND